MGQVTGRRFGSTNSPHPPGSHPPLIVHLSSVGCQFSVLSLPVLPTNPTESKSTDFIFSFKENDLMKVSADYSTLCISKGVIAINSIINLIKSTICFTNKSCVQFTVTCVFRISRRNILKVMSTIFRRHYSSLLPCNTVLLGLLAYIYICWSRFEFFLFSNFQPSDHYNFLSSTVLLCR